MRGVVPTGLALLVSTSCESPTGGSHEPELDPPELAYGYTTRDLHVHADTVRCEGDLARWQTFVDFAQSYLGRSLADPVEMYVWDRQADFGGTPYCSSVVAGCLDQPSGRVYAVDESVEHELVHAVVGLPNSDFFFQEGLAEALSGPTSFGPYFPLFPVSHPDAVDYVSAGHFVRWLLEEYGAEAVMDHMTGPGGVTDFEQRFGPLDGVVGDYFSTAPEWYPPLHTVSAPELESLGPSSWYGEFEVDCAAEDTRGAKAGLEVVREVTIAEAGVYSFWTSTGGPIRASAKVEPGQSPGSVLHLEIPADVIGTLPVEAGTYELLIVAPPGVESGEVRVWQQLGAAPVFPGDEP